ncbi:multidrug transporter [Duganella sp. Leaf126]|nr:multidrug transporter [Duganella sp. Leaf126]
MMQTLGAVLGPLLAGTLVAGCALQPAYQQPTTAATTTTPAYPTGPAYAAAPTANGTAAADTGWQNFLVDPRLQALVRLALDNNQDLRVALLRVSQAQAALQLQRAAALPTVGAEASAGRSSTTNNASGNRALSKSNAVMLNTAWEIDLFGRLQSLSESAREQYLASAYGRQATHILLVSQVADQYLAMLAYDEQLKVTDDTLAAARESYRIVKLQYDTGTTSALDESLAQVTLQQAEANHAAQLRLRAQAENALVLLLGQPLPADLPAATRLGQQAMLADIPAGLPSDLLLRRPDVQQAEALLRADYANIGAARAAFFPRISLTAAAGTASNALGDLFKAGTGAWSLAPELLLPLFDGGARQANLDTARINRDIGVAQYRKSVQTAFREVADGLAARGTYDTELAARQRNVDAQQRRVTLAEMLYNNGVNDYLSVLTAKTDLYNAQINLITARQNRLTSLVGLYRALGGGWIARTGDAPAPADSGAAAATPAA